MLDFADRFAELAVRAGLILATVTALVVVVERAVSAIGQMRTRRLEVRYATLAHRALDGDAAAAQALHSAPRGHHVAIARMLVAPLYAGPDPERIARVRSILERTSILERPGVLLHSRRWWRRTTGVRAVGILRLERHEADLVAALDDPIAEVRDAALDAIVDFHDPRLLPAVVVRVNDGSQHRARRYATIASFGAAGEPLLLDLAAVDTAHRAQYARALAVCCTARSRETLTRWAQDENEAVRAFAFMALGRAGLDGNARAIALDALDKDGLDVRAMAAAALHGVDDADAVQRLARHLDDDWSVAVRAAQSLKTMGEAGAAALRASTDRPGLAGQLSRQMLWEMAQP